MSGITVLANKTTERRKSMRSHSRPLALGVASSLLAAAALAQSSAVAHAEEPLLPGIDLPVPVTDVTETDTNLGSVAREVVVTFKGDDGKPEVRKLKARTQAEADQLARELNAQPGVVADVNQSRKIDPVVSESGPTKEFGGSTADGPGSKRQSLPALAGEQFGSYQWGMRAVGADNAWPVTRGAGVVVAVIDGGVDASHPDLAGQLLPQLDVPEDGRSGYFVDAHGTHVAGIIAASLDGGGVAGLANNVKVLPIRVFDVNDYADDYTMAVGFYAAVEAGAKVINVSIGGPDEPLQRECVQYAIDSGVTVVASGGNKGLEGSPVNYPAAYDGVIGVGAFTPSWQKAEFSSIGDWIDISAPGEDILSTVPGGWEAWPGTSMAAPFVAATAALVRAANPTLSAQQVESAILDTAQDDPDGDGRDTWFGAGYLQADRATLKAAQAPGGVRAIAAAAAPTAAVKVKATSGKSKLRVDVNPNKGKGYWTFQVQRQNADGSWKALRAYRTQGSKETRTINLPKGAYRVVVRAKYGFAETPSASVYLKR